MFRTEFRTKGAAALGAHPGEHGPYGTWPDEADVDDDQDDQQQPDTTH